jgi:hypothetical protein
LFKRLQFAGILPDKILHSLPGSGKLSYAAIVREIVALYAAGEAPRGIAFRLDARRVPAPCGGAGSAPAR